MAGRELCLLIRMTDQADLYKYHTKNLQSVRRGLDMAGRAAKDSVSRGNEAEEESYTRVYALTLGIWAEARLAKLLHEPGGLTDLERNQILSFDQQIERWLQLVEHVFRKHYQVRRGTLSISTLPHSAWSRFDALCSILRDDLRSTITFRNKLAHGQWQYALNSRGDAIATVETAALRQDNILILQQKRQIIEHLTNAIHDLVVSKATFERDFDKNYSFLINATERSRNLSFPAYRRRMREKYERGKARRHRT